MADIIHDDPMLEPYRGVICRRMAHVRELAGRLTGGGRLSDWASAHEYYGLHRVRGGWVFREWAPNATEMWLVGDFSDWKVMPAFKLRRKGGTDDWEGRFPAGSIRHGQYFRLEMRWKGGHGERIPAYARRVVQDRSTGLFAAQVWTPRPYVWKNASIVRRGGRRPAIPLIY